MFWHIVLKRKKLKQTNSFSSLKYSGTLNLLLQRYLSVIIDVKIRTLVKLLNFVIIKSMCVCVLKIVYFSTVRGCRPGKSVSMSEQEVRGLCLKSREIFLQQPILLELEAPLKICGTFVYYVFKKN